MKQLMKNKKTGQVVEFKGCLFNDSTCVVIFDDNKIIYYDTVQEFRNNWEKV